MHPAREEVPPSAAKWVRMIVGFGVSVAVGLSPFLGQLGVPLFAPLLNLIPSSIRTSAVAVSAALMGLTAVWIQWQFYRRPSDDSVPKLFRRAGLVAICSLSLLFVAYSQLVTEVPIRGQKESLYFVTGFSDAKWPQCSGLSNAQCIGEVTTTDYSRILSCFGERQIKMANLALQIPYFAFLSSFGAMIGALMLSGNSLRHSKQRNRALSENL